MSGFGAKPAALDCRNVTKHFQGVVALQDVDLEIRSGEIVGMIGPNGSGKTTLVNVISGFYSPDGGDVLLAGQPIGGMSPSLLRRAGLSRTFQNLRLYEELTVLDNLLIGLHLAFAGRSRWHRNWVGALLSTPGVRRREREYTARARLTLKEAGLAAYCDKRVKHVPYGIKKRLELCRALIGDPTLLLLDEPTAGLSPDEANDILHFFQRPVREAGLAVLLIEHRLDWVLQVCDRIVVLDSGRKLAEGKPSEIMALPEVITVYVGS